jgi:hypothetical protein
MEPATSEELSEIALDRAIEAIAKAVQDRKSMDIDELYSGVGARYWGQASPVGRCVRPSPRISLCVRAAAGSAHRTRAGSDDG